MVGPKHFRLTGLNNPDQLERRWSFYSFFCRDERLHEVMARDGSSGCALIMLTGTFGLFLEESSSSTIYI